jgi:unsaturated pyranuronate lyase
MPVLKSADQKPATIRPGVRRTLIHVNNLMMTIIEFSNGPWDEPEPYHNHVHEQITYVAEGELMFLCEGETDQRLKAGDLFSVHSNKMHTIKLISKSCKLIDSFTPIRKEFL